MNNTVLSERLIYVDLQNNNNKFWTAEVDSLIVSLEWGRVGDDTPQKTAYTYNSPELAIKNFESKVNAKLKKGYTKQQTMAVGRPANVAFVAKVQIEHSKDKETEALIDFLVKRNIHKIEGTTSIRMEAGQLTTPLGPVTSEGLDEAEKLLESMAKPKAKLDDLANQYLRIVPRHFGRRKIEASSIFGNMRQLEAEQATLDSLRAVVRDIEQRSSAPVDAPLVFQTKLDIIDGTDKEFRNLDKLYRTTINKNHQSARLGLYKIWQMRIETSVTNFNASVGNIKQLWHGTSDVNLLSILKTGFVIPDKRSSIKITGRMFGDGIYFSDQSSKSLNYATSFWGGKSNRSFMISSDVALGKMFIPARSISGTCPKGYDSTFAQAGKSGVINNEFIVYDPSQILPKYLCEFR